MKNSRKKISKKISKRKSISKKKSQKKTYKKSQKKTYKKSQKKTYKKSQKKTYKMKGGVPSTDIDKTPPHIKDIIDSLKKERGLNINQYLDDTTKHLWYSGKAKPGENIEAKKLNTIKQLKRNRLDNMLMKDDKNKILEKAIKNKDIMMIYTLLEMFNHTNELKYIKIFNFGCFIGDMKLINLMIDENKVNKDEFKDDGLNSACEGYKEENKYVYMKIIEFLGSREWNYALYSACKNGNMNIINYIINKGANNWDFGLFGACQGGHINVIEFMIHKNKGVNELNLALRYACEGGHMEVVKLMIEKVLKQEEMNTDDWNNCLYSAYEGGNIDIVNLLIDKINKIGEEEIDWNEGLKLACEYGHMNIMELMMNNGATNWNEGLKGACSGGNMKMVDLMITNGKKDNINFNWNIGLSKACENGYMEIVKLMIENGADDFGEGIYYAKRNGYYDIVKYLKKLIDDNNI